ncbi:hypothetical protein [Bacillus piscicola]|uniref:hypothetical protein n=1 Tax=Bacillus piscicola TaxID=1632684 RepID=UPI001F096D7D|nr:hypothetical protein [Bacillus piscicola]
MLLLIIFWIIALGSVIATIKWKKPLLLTVPIALLACFVVVEIIRVPMPFWKTVQFIFDLR